jgi:hypothetical protein
MAIASCGRGPPRWTGPRAELLHAVVAAPRPRFLGTAPQTGRHPRSPVTSGEEDSELVREAGGEEEKRV